MPSVWSTVVGEASFHFTPCESKQNETKNKESKRILKFLCSMSSIKEPWKKNICFYKNFMQQNSDRKIGDINSYIILSYYYNGT